MSRAEVALATAPALDVRRLLWLAGLAAGLVLVRYAVRGLGVTGHSALPVLAFLVAGVSVLGRPGVALGVAAPAFAGASLGLVAGPGGATSLALAALVVEAARALAPGFVRSVAACALVGALAGASRIVADLPVLLGAPDAIGAPPLLSAFAHAAFGAVGAAIVPLAVRRGRR